MSRISREKVLLCLALASAVSLPMGEARHLRQQTQQILTVDFYFSPICGYCRDWVLTSLHDAWKNPEFKPYLGTLVSVQPHALVVEEAAKSKEDFRAQQKLTLAVNCANKHLNRTQVIDVLTCVEREVSRESNASRLANTCVSSHYNSTELASCMDDYRNSREFQVKIFKNAPKSFVKDGSYRIPYFSIDGEEKPSLQMEDGLEAYLCRQIVNSGTKAPSTCGPLFGQPEDTSHGPQCGNGSPCLLGTTHQEIHAVPVSAAKIDSAKKSLSP